MLRSIRSVNWIAAYAMCGHSANIWLSGIPLRIIKCR